MRRSPQAGVMKTITQLAVAAAAAGLLAACSNSHNSPGAASARGRTRTPSPGIASPARAARSPNATQSSVPAPALSHTSHITMKQAKHVYMRIVEPGTKLAGTVAHDGSDAAPFTQFRTAVLAYGRALQVEIEEFRAVHWPASVRSRITAIVMIYLPADIRCLQAVAAAGNMAAANAVSSSNRDCQMADSATIPAALGPST
jgi:ABC-type phosphate transport system substrate-binding protein